MKAENRLSKEKSPYLLQHAYNPVDWHPWGEEAFRRAREEDRPILLSIGYSTCHWCHVMEKESFEDVRTAELLNRDFVSIKVDREERPDLDSVYMKYVMASTGGGGWPMTVFLTPDRKPFYGGTYFPPEDRYGMPGFKTLLTGIADAWKTRRSEILDSAESATRFLQVPSRRGARKTAGPETLKEFVENCAASFDPKSGGFGGAPKFPRSHALSLLLRYWKRTGDDRPLEMAEKTLVDMARGGIRDHLGGGFHRYSTDALWRVPHFEKMLYDQALLSVTALEAFQETRKGFYADVAREILDYVLERLTDSHGGFYSAEDADSADPDCPDRKSEGAYYVWTEEEIRTALGAAAAEAFFHRFGVLKEGNAIQDPHGGLKGKNTLYEAHSLEETASFLGRPLKETQTLLEDAKKKLVKIRGHRPRPHLDDKVLTDWNGLMIAAFALAARVLEDPRYLEAAVRAGEFISQKLTGEDGRLLHRYRAGEAGIAGHLDDYAFMAHGYGSLYEATFDERWLQKAREVSVRMCDLFYDAAEGGFFLTARDAETLIVRPKEIYDGALPSGNSYAVLTLLKLALIADEPEFAKAAHKTLEAFSEELSANPMSYPQMLAALDFALGPSTEILLAGEATDPAVKAMVREIYLRFLPNKIIMLQAPGKKRGQLSAFYETMGPVGKKATAYVCRARACRLPATDLEGLKEALEHQTEKGIQ